MRTRLPAGIVVALLLTALVGCAGSLPAYPSPSAAAPPKGAPPISTVSGRAEAVVPADVCTNLPFARVNVLTGWDLTTAQVVGPQGYTASECLYMNAADATDASEQVNALVVTGADAGTLWEETRHSIQDGYADLAGVGKRAYTADGVIAVDYGGLVIIVDDWASTEGGLVIDQLRFLVDELHALYS